MNWQFIFSALGVTFLLCLVLITFFARKKLGWVGGIRLSIIMFAMIAIFTLFTAWLTSLPESNPLFNNILLFTSLAISICALVFTAWQWSKFFLLIQKAGRLGTGIAHRNYVMGWIFSLVWGSWGLYLIYEARASFFETSFLFFGCLQLMSAIRSTQYRQNGIVFKGQIFISWELVESLSWKTFSSYEMLNLHLISSSDVISLTIPAGEKNDILNFLKLKLPTQLAQANYPNKSSEIVSPPTSLLAH
ncbi:MAG: hypothetical protein H6636_11720 [Anaerolineales bacterium]|nr:hypothetical protein [Anaerolineales bacterium]